MKLYFDLLKLQDLAKSLQEKYQKAAPYPNIYIDNFMDTEPLEKVLEEFPDPEQKIWKEYENYFEGKLETQGEAKVGAFTSNLLYQFNSAPFIQFLETLTGIKGLIPDPYFMGGGLHQMKSGGKLGVHADFSKHETINIERRINAILYLNKDWKPEYNGDLQLWDKDMKNCEVKIQPLFNRLAVFNVTDFNYHGVPDELKCPEGMTRKSLALYYFTVDRPEGEIMEGKKSTLFVTRPGEEAPKGTVYDRGSHYSGLKEKKNLNYYIGLFLPPIITRIFSKKR
jgi:Rps23 Pro-64 3,4-dihydroxylase Tpa1-like proline 4-hydroxylase